MLLLAAGVNMSNPDPALAEGYEHLTYQEVTDRLSACGVKQISISFDEELQDDVIQIGDTDLSDSQLRCIVHATHKTFYNVELQGPFLGSYYEIREELAWPETKARLEAFFAERPHLGPPPQRIDGESDDDLAQRIELFCGPKAKGAFTREFGALTISMEWAGMPLISP